MEGLAARRGCLSAALRRVVAFVCGRAQTFSWTPLVTAAYKGHVEFVRLMLDRGADKEAKTKVRAQHSSAATRCVGAWC